MRLRNLWAVAALAAALVAQTPTLTTVSDSAYLGAGTVTVVLTHDMTTPDGYYVPQGAEWVITLGATGTFSQALPPNVGSSPSNTSYTAYYNVTPGGQYSRTWIIPQSSTPVDLATVQTGAPAPSPTLMFPITQVTPPGGCALQFLEINSAGNGWTCSSSSGGMVYPAAGVAVSTGSAWGTSLQTGTASGDLPVLGSSGLPAVGGSLLTGLTFGQLGGSPTATQIGGAGTLTNSTSGNAATASALAATPAQCSSGNYATGTAANGNANCAQVNYSQLAGTPPTAPVTSVFGRTGAVVAASGDYAANQVTNAFDVALVNAIVENAAPGGDPAAGTLDIWADSTNASIEAKNPAGTITEMVQALTATSHQFVTSLSATGVLGTAQPSCADLSNAAASCSTDATDAANINSGTLPAARLPDPTASTLGGIESIAATTHEWVNAIATSGVPSQTQPACGDLSNSGSGCTAGAATTGAEGIVQLAGDIAGTAAAPTVTNLSHVTNASLAVSAINATGTASSSTYLRGDGTWNTPSGGGGYTSAIVYPFGAIESSSAIGPFGGDLTLVAFEAPNGLKLTNITFDVSTADSTNAAAICIYGPYTSAGASTPLFASTSGTKISTSYRNVNAISGGTVTGAPGIYFAGIDAAAGSTLKVWDSVYDSVGSGEYRPQVLYDNTAFLTGQTGSCPSSITAPTLALTSPTALSVPWLTLSEF